MLRATIFAALAGTLAACGGEDTPADPQDSADLKSITSPANSNATSLKMYVLDCGTIEISDIGVFSTTGEFDGISDVFTDTCFLIRHPEGDLLWDLGLHTSLVGEPPQEDDIFTVSMDRTITDQLIEIGMGPEEIEYVAISHQHFDHIGQVDQVQDATWLVHEDEYTSMFPPVEDISVPDTEPEGFEGTDAGFGSPFAGFETLKRELFAGEKDVFGDGSVIIFPTPGHTPGHTSLFVTLPKSGVVALTGDLYHRTESRAGEHVPQLNVSEEMTRDSMKAFEARVERLGAKVIIQHEPNDTDPLPKSPAPME